MVTIRCTKLLLVLLLVGLGQLWAQPCAVGLGADTAVCAANYVLQPGLSVAVFEDSLEIIYDATQGQSGLVGATKVYLHSAAEMVPFGGWQNPVGNWGQDDGIGQMTSLGSNRWRIRLVPHLYYSFPANVTPNGLFMVFRNADGSATGKDGSGNDIFADMAQNPPTSAFGGVLLSWKRDALDSLHWSDGSSGSSLNVTATGTYWVQMTDTGGCMASDTIVVTLGAIPLVDLGQPAICDGNAVVLDAGAGFASYAWSTGAFTQTITLATPGLITVTVTNAAGCSGIDVVNVPAATTPVAGFFPSIGLFDVLFVDQSSGGLTYQWDFDSDGLIDATTPGTTSYTYPMMGTFTATLIVTNECGSDTISQTFFVGEIGFPEASIADFELYPNPASRQLNLDLKLKKGISLQWQLIDATGKVADQGDEGRVGGVFRKEFDIQPLPVGIYQMLILADGKSLVRSFVKL